MAKDCIRLAIETTAKDDLLGASNHLKLARRLLARADRLIMRKHMMECMPKFIRKHSKNQVIDEVMKTYKYAHL